MRGSLLALVLCSVALALPAPAHAIGQCGLPSSSPWWVDFGTPDLIDVFAKPGLIVSGSTGDFPARLRARGAHTVYWDMNLNRRVGTPFVPADPALIVERANRLFDFAAAQSGCEKPVIALNELFGASLPTPWSATNARYRNNVLVLVRTLAERGARPFLLVSSAPYTRDEAGDWWREVARYTDILPETYFNARNIWRSGPITGNRTLRATMRRAVARFVAIGIPPAKIGLVLGFQSGPGTGGRERLQPDAAWFEVVKWNALAARQVSRELRTGSVWSWGWGTYSVGGRDPDKPRAACVYLWTRNPSLCDGPAAAGPGFDPSLTEGQIVLPSGRKCSFGGRRGISTGAVAQIARVTGDRDVALSILLARFVEAGQTTVAAGKVLVAERAIVAARFRGSRAAYVAELRRAGASVALARAALADELRRLRIEEGLRARPPSAREVGAFYAAYPDLLVRRVEEAKPAPWWLGGRSAGLALEGLAPEQVFRVAAGRLVTLRGVDGTYALRVVGGPQPLGTVPFAQARPTIAAALAAFGRRSAFEQWTVARQLNALRFATCTRDELPAAGTIRLAGYLPFLSLVGL
jgi:hypothetical protein